MKQLLTIDPHSLPALLELAQIDIDQADPVGAETLLTHALDISPHSPEVNNLLGALLSRSDRYPEAMDRFETTLSSSPQDPTARAGEFTAATTLALQAKAAGKPEAALLCLEHALTYLPGSVDLLTDIGVVAGELKLLRRADRSLKAALAIDPRNARALYAEGRFATDANRLSEAETYLKSYLALKPDDATAHFGLGHVLAMELNAAGAKAEFEESIALQPAQSESFYQLGVLAANEHEDEQAAALFRNVVARNPEHGGALTGLGQIAYRRRDYPAAQLSLTRAVAAAPDYQPAHYYLGLTLARLGQASASAQELKKATDLTQQQQSKAAPERSEAAIP